MLCSFSRRGVSRALAREFAIPLATIPCKLSYIIRGNVSAVFLGLGQDVCLRAEGRRRGLRDNRAKSNEEIFRTKKRAWLDVLDPLDNCLFKDHASERNDRIYTITVMR